MALVVDASVAVKWVVPEVGSERATAIRAMDEDLIAPSLVYAEIGNAIWRAVLRGEMTAPEARQQLRAAVAHYRHIVPLQDLADDALALATRLRHPIYDCFYLALADRERCALITADARLIAMAKSVKGIEVRRL
ncbi:MAG: type II toxin-antitoxin system VapC family toxin [Xanthobacteraceae bacterium]